MSIERDFNFYISSELFPFAYGRRISLCAMSVWTAHDHVCVYWNSEVTSEKMS